MKDNTARRIIGLFLVVLGVFVFVAIISVQNIRRARVSSDWVNHTHEVILEVNAILSSLHAGDASLRSYLLTGDPRDQGSYRTAYSDMVGHLETAEALTRDESDQHQILSQLESLIRDHVDQARAVVQSREQSGVEAVTKVLESHPDQESLDAIQRLVDKLNAQENDLLRARDKESYLEEQATRWTVMAGVTVNFLVLAFTGWLITDDIAARRRAAMVLQDANTQLETKVQERTADLAKTNESLKKKNLEQVWANQALEHQLRYSQLIINSIDDLVFVISKVLNISRVNPAVEKQSGWAPQEIITQSLDRVLQLRDDSSEGASSIQNLLVFAMKESREIRNKPALLLCKDGKTRKVTFSLIPLHDEDKTVGGVVTVKLSEV